jgi:polyphosphate kinase
MDKPTWPIYDRELSWLSFNERVLQEARDPSVPLLERLKFLAIFSSNLDEFFRVRVASVRSLLRLSKKSMARLEFNPSKLLNEMLKVVAYQQEEFGDIFRNQVLPELARVGVFLVNNRTVSDDQGAFVRQYYRDNVAQHLTPVLLRRRRQAPFLKNRTIYLCTELWPKGDQRELLDQDPDLGMLEIPSTRTPRFIEVPGEPGRHYVMYLDDVIRYNLPEVYPEHEPGSSYSFKVTRDAELHLADEFSGNLVEVIRKCLKKRERGVPSRFLYDLRMPYPEVKLLKKCFRLENQDLVVGGRYHNLSDLFGFPGPDPEKLGGLTYEPLPPLPHPELDGAPSLLEAMRERDHLLSFPYQSFSTVLRFFDEAADDPAVEEIGVTLYRVARSSSISSSLIRAAQAGKRVTVVVELKARFDEERNLEWAERMQDAGVRVLYSMPELKVHAKVALVVRREGDVRRLYAYFGTGNFNEDTARLYCDHALLTSDPRLTEDAALLFRYLSGEEPNPRFKHLLVAPMQMRKRFYSLIDDEVAAARAGQKASILCKLNSLEDTAMLERLYRACQAGVGLRVIVRGLCRLVPGVPGQSDGVLITSIIDRFLEHARAYVFHHGGEELMILGSADWMQRNLTRRVEVCFPLYAPHTREQLRAVLDLQLCDNAKARLIDRRQKNTYYRGTPGSAPLRAQTAIYAYFQNLLAARQAA